MTALAIGGLGTPELLIILAVLVLLFGAAKLPELARGSGRALRIFKAETKGLMDGDDDADVTPTSTEATKSQKQLELEARQRDLAQRQAELDAEAEKLRRGESA
jgi:sec-independent protein translocase protein TatA